MRWITLLLFILSCAREVYKPPPIDYPEAIIEILENGFEFHWIVEREKGDMRSTFKASGIYRCKGDFDMEGVITIGDTEEPISGIDPYREINNLTGKGGFELISHRGDELVYSFTANLSLFSPGGKEGEGKLIIVKEWIKKISAKTEGIDWEMKIEPKHVIKGKNIKIKGDVDPHILKMRLEYYGEKNVEIKGDKIYFEEVIPIEIGGLLLKKGDYSIYAIKRAAEGKFILSPDSIESYNPKRKIDVTIEDVRMRVNERGGYLITVDFNKPVEEPLLGILIDGGLFGIGHPGGLSLRFTVKNDKLSREIYAILKSHVFQIRKN